MVLLPVSEIAELIESICYPRTLDNSGNTAPILPLVAPVESPKTKAGQKS